MEAALACYELTRRLPSEERFELAAQMRRAAVSIPSNVAEGHSYGTDPMLCKHWRNALGSLGELETQIELAQRLSYPHEGRRTERGGTAHTSGSVDSRPSTVRELGGVTRFIVWLVCGGALVFGFQLASSGEEKSPTERS